MSGHTKEPWKVGETTHEDGEFIETAISALDGSGWVAVCLDFGFNNPEMREANARRIVACVNACAGVTTESVEMMDKNGGLAGLRSRTLKNIIDLENLLAASKITVGALMDSYRTHGTEWLLDETMDLRNAIAEIEASK